MSSIVTIVKYLQYTKVEIKMDVPNDMPVPDMIQAINKQYPGYVITSIEINHPSLAKESTVAI